MTMPKAMNKATGNRFRRLAKEVMIDASSALGERDSPRISLQCRFHLAVGADLVISPAIVLVSLLAIGHFAQSHEPRKEGSDGDQSQLVATLLKSGTAAGDSQQFMDALSALASEHHWDSKLPDPRSGCSGACVAVDDEMASNVVVTVTRPGLAFPDRDRIDLFLLDPTGKLLDELTCDVSNRATVDAIFDAQVARDEVLGLEVIIRLTPGDGHPVSGNFAHRIRHDGGTHSFQWPEYAEGKERRSEWDEKGLCRVTVRTEKFVVVFPEFARDKPKTE